MNRALFAGSFDPFTNGHLDTVERAGKLFDELVIAVATNTSKQGLFTADEKVSLIEEAVSHLDNVKVINHAGGLTVDLAKDLGANIMIRGLRSVKDYEYESQIAQMNRTQDPKIETLFLLSDPNNLYISSTIVKEIAMFDGDISHLVPKNVAKAMEEKYSQN